MFISFSFVRHCAVNFGPSLPAARHPAFGREIPKLTHRHPATTSRFTSSHCFVRHRAVNFRTSLPAARDPAFGPEIPKLTHWQAVRTSRFKYDVFINHRGKDVKNTVASLVFYNLSNRNLEVFLDNKAMEHGDCIPNTIFSAICTASVHIAIFSKHYAESSSCLHELCLMMESGAPIIPIFCGVRPCDLRMQRENGIYSKALQTDLLEKRVDSESADKWKAALTKVSYNYGFQFEGDHGLLLERIAESVMKHIHGQRRL